MQAADKNEFLCPLWIKQLKGDIGIYLEGFITEITQFDAASDLRDRGPLRGHMLRNLAQKVHH